MIKFNLYQFFNFGTLQKIIIVKLSSSHIDVVDIWEHKLAFFFFFFLKIKKK